MSAIHADFSGSRDVAGADLTVPSVDGTELRARAWDPGAPAAGVVVVAHGLGEHGGRYGDLALALASRARLATLAVDLRGHGRSPGKRAYTRTFADLVGDYRAALESTREIWPEAPRIALGHSMGGVIALEAIAGGGTGVSGLILSNPALAVAAPVPLWKWLVGKALLHVAPTVTLEGPDRPQWLTRDPGEVEKWVRDPLVHQRLSAPLFFGLTDAGQRWRKRAGGVDVPTLMLLGGSDPLVDPRVSRQWFAGLGGAENRLVESAEMRHDPLHELGREVMVEAMAEWITARLGGSRPG